MMNLQASLESLSTSGVGMEKRISSPQHVLYVFFDPQTKLDSQPTRTHMRMFSGAASTPNAELAMRLFLRCIRTRYRHPRAVVSPRTCESTIVTVQRIIEHCTLSHLANNPRGAMSNTEVDHIFATVHH